MACLQVNYMEMVLSTNVFGTSEKRLSFFLAGDLLPSSSDSDGQAAFERTGPLIVHLKNWMPSTTGMAENL